MSRNCFDKEKEVKGIFEDNGTLLDTPIDESVLAPSSSKVPKVRADHYEALSGKDAHFEALAGEENDYEVLTGGGEVACSEKVKMITPRLPQSRIGSSSSPRKGLKKTTWSEKPSTTRGPSC